MSASLQLSHVTLRVSNLARSVAFYGERLGLTVVKQAEASAKLATEAGSPPLLTLIEDPAATAPPPDTAGLFHAALLFPNRGALGAWLHAAAQRGVAFDGFSDHAVSEAIYFSDPDGNGLEFYADRPAETWPFTGTDVAMVTKPLNLPSLLSAGQASVGPPLHGAHWGHLHLRVTDLERSERFYRETLGVEVTQRSYPGARFLAADRYHHHLGLNTWGHPRQPQSAAALGLVDATFARVGMTSASEQRDPDGIAIRTVPKA